MAGAIAKMKEKVQPPLDPRYGPLVCDGLFQGKSHVKSCDAPCLKVSLSFHCDQLMGKFKINFLHTQKTAKSAKKRVLTSI